MNKKYIVRLTDEERAVCEATVKKEKGKSEKLRRAMILLKADVDGPGWKDAAGAKRKTGRCVGRISRSGRAEGSACRLPYRFSCMTVLTAPPPWLMLHCASMSCLPPATFSRSASLSSPSLATWGMTT